MNSVFLRRARKVYVPEGCAQWTDAHIGAFQKNVESLGFVCSPTLLDRVRTLPLEQLESFYEELIKALQQLVGAHQVFEPFYPNFPRQVMEMAEAELYLNATCHYATNLKLTFEREPRQPLQEATERRLIELGTPEEFERIFTRLVSAKTSLSLQDKEDVAWFISQHRDDIQRILPQAIPFKENLAVVGAALLRSTSLVEYLGKQIQTATDVLRLAVALCDGDVSLAEPTKFKGIRRQQRRTLLGWLERLANPTEDMLRWKQTWKRLGEALHPGEYATQFPKTNAAFQILRDDKQFSTFNGSVEDALHRRDVPAAIELLLQRPGELTRRLDHLLRLGRAEHVLAAFRQIVDHTATPMLLQVLCHFGLRSKPMGGRTVFPKGEVAKAQVLPSTFPPLPADTTGLVEAIARESLSRRFAQRSPLGKCHIDPRLGSYLVPFSQRSASKSLRTLVRGSRVPMPAAKFIRFFLWWKNGTSRTDIDLSAVIFNEQYRYIDVLSYYQLKGYGGHHSGDIVDAPNGACEFIDLDIARMIAQQARYIVMTVHSFTQQPYCDLPECFAGWMGRQHANSGEIFEPRTVQDKVDVTANTRICIPLILDLVTRQVVWTDLALRKSPAWNNVAQNISGISNMLYGLTHLVKPNLHALLSLHAQARGQLVTDAAEADTVFSVEQGITPFDFDRIAADFL
ncbi:TerD family protein [Anatilimnocola sp. NA78]|uniref:TerD family protein n=1 Tax=Anatilimnocola sp. NA78 TaxID=3415683 RepID=UPI003CE5383A